MKPVLLQPVITEKSMSLANTGWFTFKVSKESNKKLISKTVEDQFKVHVEDVRTITYKNAAKRTGRKRLLTNVTDTKKAIVKLKKGEKINLFDIGGQK